MEPWGLTATKWLSSVERTAVPSAAIVGEEIVTPTAAALVVTGVGAGLPRGSTNVKVSTAPVAVVASRTWLPRKAGWPR
jgi:hypothetical protein